MEIRIRFATSRITACSAISRKTSSDSSNRYGRDSTCPVEKLRADGLYDLISLIRTGSTPQA